MMIQVVLANRQHPEYGVVTIPFPIKNEDYDQTVELLEPLEIGDAVKRDCCVEEIRGDFPALKQLEQSEANLDELDYEAAGTAHRFNFHASGGEVTRHRNSRNNRAVRW